MEKNKKNEQGVYDVEFIKKKIKNLERSLIFFSFSQGINFSSELSIYFIYYNIYEINLKKYAIFKFFLLLVTYLRPLIGLLIDNVLILKSNRKSYLYIILILEFLCYLIMVTFASLKKSILTIFIANLFLKFLFVSKEVILVSLTFTLKNYYQTQKMGITYNSAQKSLAVHYASKYIGRLIAFTLIYFFDRSSSLKSVFYLCVVKCCQFNLFTLFY